MVSFKARCKIKEWACRKRVLPVLVVRSFTPNNEMPQISNTEDHRALRPKSSTMPKSPKTEEYRKERAGLTGSSSTVECRSPGSGLERP
jgi:hypothetical protein